MSSCNLCKLQDDDRNGLVVLTKTISSALSLRNSHIQQANFNEEWAANRKIAKVKIAQSENLGQRSRRGLYCTPATVSSLCINVA
jgi:hypothetical protein